MCDNLPRSSLAARGNVILHIYSFICFFKDDILNTLSNLVTFSLNDSTGYKENLIKVEIFFEEFDFELMQEVPAYQVIRVLEWEGKSNGR